MERAAFLIEESGRRIDCLLNPETIVFKREAGLKRRSVIGQLIGDAPWSDDMLLSGGGGLVQLQLDLLFDTSLQSSPPVDDVQLLTGRRDVLETGAKQLLEKETLDESDLKGLREALQMRAAADAPAARAAV